jgi:hypothetical protein
MVQAATAPRRPITGLWKLLSYQQKDAQGNVAYPYGQDLTGFLMYGNDGFFSLNIMKKVRMQFRSDNFLDGSNPEKFGAADSYLSYIGRYQSQGNKITHHVLASFFPNWTGAKLEHVFKIEGKHLLLVSPPYFASGTQQNAHMLWEKIERLDKV